MTLQNAMDTENPPTTRSGKTMDNLLRLSVKQAIKNGRLHIGMTSCAQLFKRDPSSVMICLLPISCEQLSVRINHTLIRAFCQERNIPVIPISDEHHFKSFIKKMTAKNCHEKVKGDLGDMSCFLLQIGSRGPSKCDSSLIQQCNQYIQNGIPIPLVNLPG